MGNASASADNLTATTSKPFPFSFQGKTGYFACVPSGPTSCEAAPAGTASENTFVDLVYEGTPTQADATLTWAATTPATAEMYITMFAIRSCGEGCIEFAGDSYSAFASGASPLTLSATGIKLAENETLAMHVGTMDPTPPVPAPFFYSLEQAFAVEGTVTSLVAAPAS